MEGPTPVSSLLHSCTLVMAGIFGAYNVGTTFDIQQGSLFVVSLAFVVLTSRVEKDAKRTVALSTVVMVSAIWLLLVTSLSASAVAICLFHAAYKSASFLAIGRILTKSSTYADSLAIPSSVKTLFAVVGIFLVGLRTSGYAVQKHSTDTLATTANDFWTQLIFGTGGLVL